MLPGYNQAGPYFVGPPTPQQAGMVPAMNPFQQALSNPIAGLGIGLLSGAMGNQPGLGLQQGFQNMMAARRADESTYLLGQRIAEMRRQRQERERIQQARENLRAQYPNDPRMQAMVDAGLQPGDLLAQQTAQAQITSREGIAAQNLEAQRQNRAATQALTAATQGAARSHRETQFNQALSKQFTAENKQSQERIGRYRDIRDFYGNESDMTGADDLKLIYSVAKMINPGEAIMQGDMDSIIRAGGIPDMVKSFAQQIKGEGQLSEPARQQLLATARPLGETALGDVAQRRAEYAPRFYGEGEAGRWLPDFDPEQYRPAQPVEGELLTSAEQAAAEGRPAVQAAQQRYMESLEQSGFKAEDVQAVDVQSVLDEIERRSVEKRRRGRNR